MGRFTCILEFEIDYLFYFETRKIQAEVKANFFLLLEVAAYVMLCLVYINCVLLHAHGIMGFIIKLISPVVDFQSHIQLKNHLYQKD